MNEENDREFRKRANNFNYMVKCTPVPTATANTFDEQCYTGSTTVVVYGDKKYYSIDASSEYNVYVTTDTNADDYEDLYRDSMFDCGDYESDVERREKEVVKAKYNDMIRKSTLSAKYLNRFRNRSNRGLHVLQR